MAVFFLVQSKLFAQDSLILFTLFPLALFHLCLYFWIERYEDFLRRDRVLELHIDKPREEVGPFLVETLLC